MRMMGLAAVAATMLCGSAQAAVTYNFVGTYNDGIFIVGPESFALSTSDFITKNTIVTSFTVGNATRVQFCFPGDSCGGFFTSTVSNYVLDVSVAGGEALYLFSNPPFAADGVYNTISGSPAVGTLTVTGSPTLPAAAPEPATWAMMIGGFGLVGAAMRRRKAAVSFA